MSDVGAATRSARVEFTGTRRELFGLLFRGYVLMLPTLGIYRFWVTTWKRRYYWMHTVIDGEPLEYTGNALQLLVGFLFALAFFLPNYLAFFYFSTQSGEVVAIGYGIVAVILWFLTGYAIYRGRDFRLSRTLWRGIRFDQKGNAWGYALRRFLWSLLVGVTLGLAYPFMAASLWRYRWNHTWYGDRQLSFVGSWKTIAGPYYLVWFLVAASLVFCAVSLGASEPVFVEGALIPGPGFWLALLLAGLVSAWGYFYYRSREATRMFSSIRAGAAAADVKVGAWALFGQFMLYNLALVGALIVLGIVGVVIMGAVMSGAPGGLGSFSPATVARAGWVAVAALILGYLAVIGAFALLGEVFLGYGYWALVARRASISNADTLRGVRATSEDESVVGEGLADALNVGSY